MHHCIQHLHLTPVSSQTLTSKNQKKGRKKNVPHQTPLHPPKPPTTKSKQPKPSGTRKTPPRFPKPTPPTPSGGTATNFSQAPTKSSPSSPQNGKKRKNYKLRKELFAATENRIAVQFWYEYQDESDGMKWKRCYGLEDWTFDDEGKMRKRQMSGNDVEIAEGERWFTEGVDVDSVKIGEEHW